MNAWRCRLVWIAPLLLLAVVGFRRPAPPPPQSSPGAGQYPASLLAGLQWRNVGPLRAGRSYAVAGNANQPDTYYFGSAGGGVWKTVNAGRTWQPIGDKGIPIGSIGAIAVAPSNPDVVYVGTGEPDIRSQHSYGIGMFKSTDAGKTWTAIGLRGSRQIGRIVVDPHNPDRVYVAALGSPYEANPTRGVYRSTNGGASWKQVLRNAERPNDVGAVDLAIDMQNPQVLYASMWSTRRPPWSVYAPSNLPGGGLYKSTDGGDHWTKLGGGLPADNFVGKIGIAIAPSNPNRLWASIDDLGTASPTRGPEGGGGAQSANAPATSGGIYVSDDAGAHWRLVNSENRLWGRGWYFEQLAVDPTNPDKAYVINTATYVTTDGGAHFTPLKGSPGGDDYHQLWVNPKDGNRMVLSSDQGTVVSVDGGKTWSSWYNQSTAQIYHLSADNRYPYWLYGPQQDSGAASAAVAATRENVITFRNWLPICAGGESNSVVPDPKDPAILYSRLTSCNQFQGGRGGGFGGGRRGGPAADPNDPARKTWTLPTVISPADAAIYTSDQFLYRSRDGAKTWDKISPDLTRLNPPIPANLDPLTAKDMDERMTGLGPNHDQSRYGVIYTISPSPLNAATIWAGTDDGYIQLTRDGGETWDNVTPPALTAWSKISQIDAGHFDANTAYASVDRHRLGDDKAYIYRTNDGGKTWQLISNGIPDGAFVNSIKEDPVQKGLLYAATELRVYVSFDDGAHWQSLQNNMPVVSVRDIIAHDGDLDIATFGRGFYVLDNMAPLRQIAEQG
ncbi:MAG: WD40/YVTN/BNR-like repeat-containing protein, partial [Terriglobales bacterium]